MKSKGGDVSEGKPAGEYTKEVVSGQWTTGLWDCREDGSNCLQSCFCPCVTFGQIAEIIDRGTTPSTVASILYCGQRCPCLYGSLYRTKLRRLFSLPEAPYSDLVVHSCCCICSLSQEYREFKNRGINPSLGWEANVEKWKAEGLTPPIIADGMSR
ncbi:protein PLANT CADMIUM RESISTANCE 9-like isoform X2 [Punica granatum]|uniref:Protein PLANT CADMIUM RESISTANCE 9-like isoform X2 n=1 Tax=Punica granatum TaxID=22663 RepID=A0A6P8E0Y0_PUNGR|nr:protein PLANT CADMIUM RESISTANCE 9-like isoform X2 [Punica granatum]